MKEKLEKHIIGALKELFGIENPSFVVEHPKDLSHGDYATNVALVVSKQISDLNLNSPLKVAEAIVDYLEKEKPEDVGSVSIAGPGFINIKLSRNFFSREVGKAVSPTYSNNALYAGKRIMIEYTDPNPFKSFHIGHLMTNAIGESIARLLEASGASVIRANYQGDVGRHVAQAIYGLQKNGLPEKTKSSSEQAGYIGSCYVFGSTVYGNDPSAKEEIDILNKKVYDRSDEKINEIYDWGKKVTLEAFEDIYIKLGTKFDYYFFESEMAKMGLRLVYEWLEKGVFEESDGAVVFKGEKYNPRLHTRVFVTSHGLPTYDTKEIGLTKYKFEIEKLDQSIVVTANEQKEYMAVATEAIKQINPEIATKMVHITHGMMRFADGKMSSRTGNVITGESLILEAEEMAKEKMKDRDIDQSGKIQASTDIGIGAIKYSILRQSLGGDIIYDKESAFSFEGDSGPYLQYTATRASSVIGKALGRGIKASTHNVPEKVFEIERILYRFPEVIAQAASTLESHHITTYLTEVASRFNSFYANETIADEKDEFASYKVALATSVFTVLSRGLTLLGIRIPERM